MNQIQKLDALLTQHGLSDAQFGKRLRVSKQAIAYWRQTKKIPAGQLQAVADFFEVELVSLETDGAPLVRTLNRAQFNYLLIETVRALELYCAKEGIDLSPVQKARAVETAYDQAVLSGAATRLGLAEIVDTAVAHTSHKSTSGTKRAHQ